MNLQVPQLIVEMLRSACAQEGNFIRCCLTQGLPAHGEGETEGKTGDCLGNYGELGQKGFSIQL